jgi:hypothetical protein
MRTTNALPSRANLPAIAAAGLTLVLLAGTPSGPVSAQSASARGVHSAAGASLAQGSASLEAARQAAPRKRIVTTRWGVAGLRNGHFEHTRMDGGIAIGRRPIRVGYRDPYGSTGRLPYHRGRWYSPWVPTGFGLSELIASWNARTPRGTFIEVSVRGRTGRGSLSSWDSLGRWASHRKAFHRMSLGAQRDDLARVAVDTLVTDRGVRFAKWQLRVSLFRCTGTARTPTVTMLAAMASRIPDRNWETSTPGPGPGLELRVPRYSQMIHEGEYPEYNGGGEAWCSPTSTSMVLGYWNSLPTRRQYAWVNDAYDDPWVDHAARQTFAWGYDGTGDWPFNTAYAGELGLDAFVTRLRSLREAELFIQDDVPLVASIAFDRGELDGAPISSTSGHVVVIRGFTDRGRVIVNDPAGDTNDQVRRVYKRRQFENAWIDRTGGVVYVIHPKSHALPNPRLHSNW